MAHRPRLNPASPSPDGCGWEPSQGLLGTPTCLCLGQEVLAESYLLVMWDPVKSVSLPQ